MNGHYNLDGEFVENSPEAEAVNEIIREENAPQTLEDVAKEIQGVMVVNALLNGALQVSTAQVAEMQARIDEMLKIAETMNERVGAVVNSVTITASRATFDNVANRERLNMIANLAKFQHGNNWWFLRLKEASRGDIVLTGEDMPESID